MHENRYLYMLWKCYNENVNMTTPDPACPPHTTTSHSPAYPNTPRTLLEVLLYCIFPLIWLLTKERLQDQCRIFILPMQTMLLLLFIVLRCINLDHAVIEVPRDPIFHLLLLDLTVQPTERCGRLCRGRLRVVYHFCERDARSKTV
jgi:hypothetical protein